MQGRSDDQRELLDRPVAVLIDVDPALIGESTPSGTWATAVRSRQLTDHPWWNARPHTSAVVHRRAPTTGIDNRDRHESPTYQTNPTGARSSSTENRRLARPNVNFVVDQDHPVASSVAYGLVRRRSPRFIVSMKPYAIGLCGSTHVHQCGQTDWQCALDNDGRQRTSPHEGGRCRRSGKCGGVLHRAHESTLPRGGMTVARLVARCGISKLIRGDVHLEDVSRGVGRSACLL